MGKMSFSPFFLFFFRDELMNKVKTILFLLVCVFIEGCSSIKIEPFTLEKLQEHVRDDLKKMYENQEPVTKPVTLPEAIARALKYNLDHRVKLMEIAVAYKIYDLTSYNMLPSLALDAGFKTRSNYSGGKSQSLLTGRESLEASTSQERMSQNIGLNLVWNVLDFGVSHATTLQKANQIMIARERRRRVSQNIIQDIHDSYWRAVAAQRLLGPIETLLKTAQEARERSRIMEAQGLQNPEIALTYRKRLLETIRQLLTLQEELTLAKDQLAALINLAPGTSYEVYMPQESYIIPHLSTSLEKLEFQALLNQPELREEHYLKRVTQLEVKKAFRRMFPGIEFSVGTEYNTNSFLYNNSWAQAGLRVTWNLLNVFTGGPAAKKEAESHVILADHRRMALSMAILTQVWVSYHRYRLALKDFKLASELYSVNDKLNQLMTIAQRSNIRSELDVVFTQVQALFSRMSKEVAYAELQSALAKINHVVGIDTLPDTITPTELLTSKETEKYIKNADEPKLVKELPVLTKTIEEQLNKPEVKKKKVMEKQLNKPEIKKNVTH